MHEETRSTTFRHRAPTARWPAHRIALACAAACGAAWLSPPALAQTAPVQQVEIIGTSPLPGQGVDRNALPYSTQVIRRSAIEAAQGENLGDFMTRRLPGVQSNDIISSPFQADLTFRGFRASSTLGASQGLSVYLDGVRINEPFGDVVNWDMVPEFALQSVSLVPGANPAFGLNTMGGALSLTTANASSAPGLRGELSFGSADRRKLDLTHGGTHEGGWSHFVGMGLFGESGWRDFSPSELGHLLGKAERDFDAGRLTLTMLLGKSRLVGNALLPMFSLDDDGNRTPDLGATRRGVVYNHPDITRNRLAHLSAGWRQNLADGTTLEALAYGRHTRRETLNGDEAFADDDTGGTGDPDANASLNRTATRQRAAGASVAWSGHSGEHQWQVGAAIDGAKVSYEQTEQPAFFTASRGVEALDDPAQTSVRVAGRTESEGLYGTDTWRVGEATHVTGTLRFNQARVSNQLRTLDDDTGLLQAQPRERFTYRSLNPALGVAHAVMPGTTVYANVARNNRVPTVIELGCADPDAPCRLPAGLVSDPYLKQVISTTVEAGLRFGGRGPLRGSLALYRTDNRDDILFTSVSVAGQLGYFRNFPRTRHQGLDAQLEYRLGDFDFDVGYSLLEATYQASGTLRVGERNVIISPGTRIAGLPRHTLKAGVDWRAAPGWRVGMDLQAFSRRTTAGNEDGLIENGGTEQVEVPVPGYAIVNLKASWQPAQMPGVELMARITNLFDRDYASFAALGETVFSPDGSAYTGVDREAWFAAPGAPRSFSLGVRWKF